MSIDINFNIGFPLDADEKAFLATLAGGAAPATGATTGTVTSAGDDAFPADPTKAPTSPENSTIVLLAGKLFGPAYLKDKDGTLHQIVPIEKTIPFPGTNSPATGWQIGGGDTYSFGNPMVELLMRSGVVYGKRGATATDGGGQWQSTHEGMGNVLYNAQPPDVALPAPATSTGGSTGTTTGTPATTVPAMPAPGAVAPGSNGTTTTVPAATVEALSAAILAAQPGDTLKVPVGIFKGKLPAIRVPILIDFQGGTIDATGLDDQLTYGKGALVPCADTIIVGVAITGAGMGQSGGQLSSAIRPDVGCGYLTIRGCDLHGNQTGVGHGGFPCVIRIEDSNISRNGLLKNDGALTHNIYVGAECRLLSLKNVTSVSPNEAHAVKFRGKELHVEGGTFESSHGKPFDLPNGLAADSTISGATIVKQNGAEDHGLIAMGEEGASTGKATLTLAGCNVQANCDSPLVSGPAGLKVVMDKACVLSGNPVTASGGIALEHSAV